MLFSEHESSFAMRLYDAPFIYMKKVRLSKGERSLTKVSYRSRAFSRSTTPYSGDGEVSFAVKSEAGSAESSKRLVLFSFRRALIILRLMHIEA